MTKQSVVQVPQSVQDIYGDHFAISCRQAAEIMHRPEYGDRLTKAMDFVLGGNVTLNEDGTATVKSGSHTYHLEPECTCEDSRRRSLYCKHFLAVLLLKRTYQRMNQPVDGSGQQPEPEGEGEAEGEAQPVAQTQPDAQPQAWECAQAPSSCTLKWSVGGIELMLTLRDATDEALFGRIKRVLPRIEEKMEVQRQARQQAQQASLSGNGGNSQAKATEAASGDPDDHYCHFHDEPMWRYEKNSQVWHSHRTEDGKWCRGK